KLDRILSKAKSELKDSKGRYYENDERKLIRRLECYRENYFLWTRNFSIPPTNNLSERSLRMQKTKLRVSGQYCCIKAAEYFADIRTYTETCSRNGISPFDALSRLMAGNPYSLDEVLSSGDCE
ncbi:MAG: transposase, partial [Clostridiales bacterium]|nr:transposase [Clostridiales bacterium]